MPPAAEFLSLGHRRSHWPRQAVPPCSQRRSHLHGLAWHVQGSTYIPQFRPYASTSGLDRGSEVTCAILVIAIPEQRSGHHLRVSTLSTVRGPPSLTVKPSRHHQPDNGSLDDVRRAISPLSKRSGQPPPTRTVSGFWSAAPDRRSGHTDAGGHRTSICSASPAKRARLRS